jgi:hypothetical protein|tara:strand:+ start:8203 stop:8790 length:588 start_codon:yes stop_codon:yes gene_type:complete
MPFWSTNFGQDTTLKDPKRKFRFTVEFQGIDAAQGGALLWYAKTAAKPSFAIGEVEHAYLNHKFYYPGSVSWNTITIGMVDPVDPDVTATISDIIVASGYSPPTDATALGSISKAKAAGALGTVIITQIDSDGNPLETWTLWNSFIKDVKFGDLEYGGEGDLMQTDIEIRYDWARVETANESSAVVRGGNQFFQV